MKTVLRNSYTPKIGDYCETIVVDKETENAYIFDCDGVFTPMPQPVDVEDILRRAAEYTDETVAPINEKLDTIEEGAQVNVIETVMKNGTPLTITNKTVNVTVPTKTSDLTNDGSDGTDTYVESATLSDYYTKTETDTQIGYETTAREIADQGLQEQIDAIVASSDVVDIVGTYAALQAYDTSKLHDNDIIKVLDDETRDDATTYYRWDADTSTWGYIGAEGPFYTKAESDATFVPQTRTVNNKALSSDITLTAADVGALPDSTVIPIVNDATLTIQKNGTEVATFTANSATNATANITVPTDTSDLTNGAGFITSAALPTKTSELTNDGSDGTDTYAEMGDLPTKTSDLQNDGADGTSTYVEADELATVATTGDYDDLLNKPTIPTVNNATLTIQKNGTNIDTFTANASVDKTINVTVPTDTSDLTNNAGFITNSVSNLTNYYTKTDTYTQQETNALINAITIPTKTSDLTNDGSDGTSTYVEADDLATVATTGDYGDLLNTPTIPTIVDMTGATASTAGAHGYVPAPAAGDDTKFLRGDGTWATGGATYSAGTGIDITSNVISADTTVLATQNDLSSKQDTLTAGDAIDITSNVISVEADSALDISSTKPVQNSVITAALNDKADTGDLPTKTSDLQNDGSDGTSTYVEADELATVATSGSYADLSNKPTIPAAQVNSDWDAASGVAQILNKPSLAAVATSGAYSDLTGTPSLATVATSGDYDDLLNKPTIPAAQVNSDWNSNSGVSQILNKPSLATVATSGSYNDLTEKPTIPTVNNATLTVTQNGTSVGTFTANSSTDTTLALTDTTYSDMVGAGASTAGTHGLVPAPAAGDEGKYLKGDGTWGTVVSGGLVEMAYGESNAWQKFIDAYNANKIVYCRASSNANPAIGSQTRKAFMAYVNNATSPTNVEFQYVRSQSSKSDSQQCDQVFIYKLTNASGGTWTVETRDMATKVNVDSTLTKTYSGGANASMTLSAKAMTGATSGAAGTAGYVPAPAAGDDDMFLKGDGTWDTPPGISYTAGAHIDITGSTISAEDYVHSEDPVSVVDPGSTVSGSNITNGSITADKFATGATLQLTLSTTDIGEGAALAANTLYGVYE